MTARPFSTECRRLASAAVVLVLLLAMAMAAGCSGDSIASRTNNTSGALTEGPGLPVPATPPIPRDKFVYIEHWIHRNGVVVPGGCCGGAVFGRPPGSYFDKTKGVLKVRDHYSDDINESFLMFYDTGGNLSGCAGTGEAAFGLPVYSLPFTPNVLKRENVTVESISADGIVILRYNQKQISLKPRETWFENTTQYEKKEWNTSSPSGEIIPRNCTMTLVVNDSFYNAGILDKGTIVFF